MKISGKHGYWGSRVAVPVAVVAMGLLAVPAFAWGPSAQLSIVNAGVNVISQEISMPLSRYESYIRDGVHLSDVELLELFPNYDIDPVGAIEEEIYLLQAVRGSRIDPYFGFRLGVLSKMVVVTTAPFQNASDLYREQYLRDVDANMTDVKMATSPRRLVDPQAYFVRVMRDAARQDATLLVDYRSGVGFDGLAKSSLSIDASRSVDAVADIIYTIFASRVAPVNVSQSDMRDYSLNAMAFYLARGSLAEAEEAYGNVVSLGVMTPSLRKSIGDAYYDAELYEEALEHYVAVLETEPGRRDVVTIVTTYYEGVGEESLSLKRLEDARDAFALALEVDPLNDELRRKHVMVEGDIAARDARLAATREAREQASEFEMEAEREALSGNYAQAISYLRDAEAKLQMVTNEFPDESRLAGVGLRSVELKVKEYKTRLVNNVQRLSGSGFRVNAMHLANGVPGVEDDAVKALLESELELALRALAEQMEASLEP